MERSGRRDKIVVYGSIADNGTILMRTYDRFNGANFVRYLELARQKWGKVLMIMDNASQHKTKKVRRYLEQNPDVRILYLPVARPELCNRRDMEAGQVPADNVRVLQDA